MLSEDKKKQESYATPAPDHLFTNVCLLTASQHPLPICSDVFVPNSFST